MPSAARIAKLAASMALLLGAILGAPLARDAWLERRAETAHPIPASDAEQAAILRPILAGYDTTSHALARRDEPAGLLVDKTQVLRPCPTTKAPDGAVAICMDNDPAAQLGLSILADDPVHFHDLPQKLRMELVQANARSTAMPDPRMRGVRLVDEYPTGPESHAPGARLHAIIASRAVLTPDGRIALVYVEHRSNYFLGSGEILLLERHGNDWRVTHSAELWVE